MSSFSLMKRYTIFPATRFAGLEKSAYSIFGGRDKRYEKLWRKDDLSAIRQQNFFIFNSEKE